MYSFNFTSELEQSSLTLRNVLIAKVNRGQLYINPAIFIVDFYHPGFEVYKGRCDSKTVLISLIPSQFDDTVIILSFLNSCFDSAVSYFLPSWPFALCLQIAANSVFISTFRAGEIPLFVSGRFQANGQVIGRFPVNARPYRHAFIGFSSDIGIV